MSEAVCRGRGTPRLKKGMPAHLEIDEIRCTLRAVQQNHAAINDNLNAHIADFTDESLDNMVAGYELVDSLVETGIDLFALGQSRRILELNNTVLYGAEGAARKERFSTQLAVSAEHFYNKPEGGIGDLVEFHQRSSFRDAWHEAAAIYIRMLARPQLFVEGNHRTGALLMSYILLREGYPPFVLSPDNAVAFFKPSTAIGRIKRRSLTMLFKRIGLQRYFARLLECEADFVYLRRG
jgi:hypothetical protein